MSQLRVTPGRPTRTVVVVEPLLHGRVRVSVLKETVAGWESVALVESEWTELEAVLVAFVDGSSETEIAR